MDILLLTDMIMICFGATITFIGLLDNLILHKGWITWLQTLGAFVPTYILITMILK